MTIGTQSSMEKLCSGNSYLRGCPPPATPSLKTVKLQKTKRAKIKKHHDAIHPPSDANPYISMVKTYAVSHVIQNALGTIQTGTKYLGQTMFKNASPLITLATANPITATAIGLGALGMLYRTFKNKNENDTNKSIPHSHKT